MTKETISKKLVREVRMCNALIRNEQFTHAMGQKNNGGQQLKKVSKIQTKEFIYSLSAVFQRLLFLKITFSK